MAGLTPKRKSSVWTGIGLAVVLALLAGNFIASNPTVAVAEEGGVEQEGESTDVVFYEGSDDVGLDSAPFGLTYRGYDVSPVNPVAFEQNGSSYLFSTVAEAESGAVVAARAAQQSRALAALADPSEGGYVTVVALDADGNVLAAVTNENGADTAPATVQELLESSAGYVISDELYETIYRPTYPAASETAPVNLLGDVVVAGVPY
jgi:hypothetical protein